MACGSKLRRTRFAPSPTGPLHLGHALAAIIAAERADPGEFLLRIEDLDQSRARPQWEAQIFDDLHWLGLDWPTPVLRQSERMSLYQQALDKLYDLGVTYRCSCSRADIRAALDAPQEGAPILGPDGLVYPGTCRGKQDGDTIRLDMARALDLLGPNLPGFDESGTQPGHYQANQDWLLTHCGDVVLARRDMGAAYHLAVVVDDAAQGITEVTRGEDLFEATYIHVILQALLGLPTPAYHHHRLIRDAAGKRLAKRDDARAIATYRAQGATPAEIRAKIGL
ncbi:tRNA glutamyl-Q(34) synthetase GluQRS [Pseudothioclava arenosa]|uniref:tRNA glutamyl-Q(34) synthetase GluQRS n=1 Tax=Pseudothioclava arenosa TaxID=1795308 RepID=A0A2A4CR40_9RHOB|nr:tRNA glutamyl-Q(34) synthetase GluQRS [Pseudothioclava arenosa]PCD76758.1 tRNA glutamyl-Q(34) synthetase GluQRS [Pseudothioclava arenosa]